MKRLVLVVLLFLAVISPALAQDTIHLPSEVLEVSPNFQIDSSALKPIHCLLIHHANASDRVRLSKWLKTNSGSQVTFLIKVRSTRGFFAGWPTALAADFLFLQSP